MAYYAALVSLVQLLKEINNPDHPHLNSYLAKEQIHVSLYEKFNHLQELLDGYSRKDHKEEIADALESQIRDVASHAQDIIESDISDLIPIKDKEKVKTNAGSIVEEIDMIKLTRTEKMPKKYCEELKKVEAEDQGLKKVETEVGSIVEELTSTMEDSYTTREEKQKKYYEELEKVEAEVDSIVRELIQNKESSKTQEENLQLNSYVSAEAQSCRNTMVGFEEQLIAVKDKLCGQSSKLEVLSIVGMGGMGKTTLARELFDDEYIVYHFHCRAWVTVSQDYRMQKVLLNLGNSMNIMNEELSREGEQVLKEHIRRHLIGMTYLIIIDDMWDVKVWDELKMIFPDKSNGSRIMITTRVSDVAVYAGNSKFFHQMQFLNEDQSWTLLKQKVFAQEHYPKELEVIGKLIAKNCKGLPLGIVVIAGVLSNVNKVQHDWEEIATNVSSVAMDQNDEHLSNILSLSYNHLPHHLKPCFLYLGGFPEDHDIRISKLIKLWVAEGFLRHIESKSLEEVGKEYFKDLVNRNLVLITQKTFSGEFKSCGIHDLVRDLCLQRARYENFLHYLQEDDVYHESIGNVHRVFASENSLFLKYTTKHYSTIRSVISFSNKGVQYCLLATANCKMLRILDAPDLSAAYFDSPISIDEISANKIFELLHLRYLTLHTSSHIYPSICKLWNLQTLIICGSSIALPCEIWKMPQLRHLILEGRHYGVAVIFPPIPYGEISIIEGVPLLGRLQTLQRVKDFIFTPHTIEMIPNLKKLAVEYTTIDDHDEAYAGWEEVGLNNLVHLHQLEKLEICFGWDKPEILLPENFTFPSSLTKLSLYGCELPWKEMTIVGSLPNLLVLKLRYDAFVGEEWEPIEGEFLKLKILLMEILRDLKYWRAENVHFPCLEQLDIEYCTKLKGIPSGIGDIPTLQSIDVYFCNSAVASSALKIQEEQRDQGNNDFQVHVEPRDPPEWKYWIAGWEDESNSEEEDDSSVEEDESNLEEEDESSVGEDESNLEEKDESSVEEDESNLEEKDESSVEEDESNLEEEDESRRSR